MSQTGKASKKAMEELHGALAKALAERISAGEATAADLAVARQFLKDNGVDAIPTDGNGLGKLAQELPFQTIDEVERTYDA